MTWEMTAGWHDLEDGGRVYALAMWPEDVGIRMASDCRWECGRKNGERMRFNDEGVSWNGQHRIKRPFEIKEPGWYQDIYGVRHRIVYYNETSGRWWGHRSGDGAILTWRPDGTANYGNSNLVERVGDL